MFGDDYNVDDIVYIGGKTKARITRISTTKTVFHIIDTDRKLIIPNTSLYGLKCEKVLPQNGGNKKQCCNQSKQKAIAKELVGRVTSKNPYTRGDLYKKTKLGKKVLKG